MSLGRSLIKLLEIASAPLNLRVPELSNDSRLLAGGLVDELMSILREKNGFNALESALHFFPAQSSLLSVGINEWNDYSGWRGEYEDLAKGCLFFCEDVFGGQFCIESDRVWSFDPETGDRKLLGSTLNEWADVVLKDYEVLTGQPLAHVWQRKNGPLPEGGRLVPRIPFVLGGEFAVDNLVLMDAEKAMRMRGNLARQIHNLPDGAQIHFVIEE